MNQDPIHSQLNAELEKMEKARRLLAGGKEPWYRSPYFVVWLAGLLLVMFLISGTDIRFETLMIVLIAAGIGSLDFQVRTAKKRIDKIVELTAVEKILEEKYKSNIRSIAECSRLASTPINDKAGSSTA